MRALPLLTVAAAAAVLLVGCTPASSTAQPSTSKKGVASPSPTPTIDPGPVALTKEQAGERYLDLMCERNAITLQINSAFAAKEDEYLSGGNPDVTAIKQLGTEALRVNRVTVELLDDSYYTWPDNTRTLVKTIRDTVLGEAAGYSAMANAASFKAAYEAPANTVNPGNAPQELRYALGLSADTSASCAGHETAADQLHAEMTSRNEYLATFDGKS